MVSEIKYKNRTIKYTYRPWKTFNMLSFEKDLPKKKNKKTPISKSSRGLLK